MMYVLFVIHTTRPLISELLRENVNSDHKMKICRLNLFLPEQEPDSEQLDNNSVQHGGRGAEFGSRYRFKLLSSF